MNKGTCIHFNGIQNDCCRAGVHYRATFDDSRPGLMLRAPCIEFHERPAHGRGTYVKAGEASVLTPYDRCGEKAVACPHRREPTDDEILENRRMWDLQIKKTTAAIKVASEWRVKPKPAENRTGVVECPICKGRLHLSQSSYNGHVHGKCETQDCVAWME